MMEKTQNLKCPCEKSARSAKKIKPNMKKMQSLIDGGAKFSEKEPNFEEHGCHISQNYGLRENPKKTVRVVDQNFPLPQDNVCKQCGKVFQSMKALCGHMAFHSERKIVMDNDFGTEFEEKKPRSKKNGKRCNRISTTKSSSYSLANASSSVTEIDEKDHEEIAICLIMLSRGYTSFKGGMNPVVEYCDNNSVVLETKSRSNGMRNIKKEGLKCVYNGDEVLGMYKPGDEKLNYSSSQENSDSGYFLDDVSMRKTAKGVNIRGYRTELMKEPIQENGRGNGNGRIAIKTWKNESKKRIRELVDYDDELIVESYKRIKYGSAYAEVSNTKQKKRKYECLNCKKSFKSLQALGGHRPCHKRNSADDNVDQEHIVKIEESLGIKEGVQKEVRTTKAVKKVRSKKQKGHICPFCPRVFKSGKALGGHKRSHFLGGNAVITNQSFETKPEVHYLFDLNFPAPQEEDDDNAQFTLW